MDEFKSLEFPGEVEQKGLGCDSGSIDLGRKNEIQPNSSRLGSRVLTPDVSANSVPLPLSESLSRLGISNMWHYYQSFAGVTRCNRCNVSYKNSAIVCVCKTRRTRFLSVHFLKLQENVISRTRSPFPSPPAAPVISSCMHRCVILQKEGKDI